MSKLPGFKAGAVVGAGAILVVTFVLVGAKAQPTQDELDAQHVARVAITAILLPYAFDKDDVNADRIAKGPKTDAMKANVGKHLDALLEPETSKEWKAKIAEAIDRQASGVANVDLTGGITSIEFTLTKLDGGNATVSGNIKMWQDFADPTSHKVTRGNGWYDFTVIEHRTGTGWKVKDTTFDMHSEPAQDAVPLPS